MTAVAFTIPAIPVAQPRQRHALIAGHVRNYTPAKHPVNAFKATARLAFEKIAMYRFPLDGPVLMRVEFVMPRPKGKCWKSKPMERYAHTSKPDLDNLLKSLKDSLHGLAWNDDSQVAQIEAAKVVAAGGEQPRVIVGIGDDDVRLLRVFADELETSRDAAVVADNA